MEYDGARFAGWARQDGQRTIQGEMEAVLATVRGEATELAVAGRTDAGVHALAQVASHPGEPLPLGAWNGNLPPDIRVLSSEPAPDVFNARHDAVSRAYAYRLYTRDPATPFLRHRALHWPYPLDREALDACAALLPGEHDLTAFTRTQNKHVLFRRNIISAEWVGGGDLLEFRIEAPSFMRNQVRILVGTMLEVGGGRRSVADFERLLQGRPRSDAGETAPPHGLYLVSVRYDLP
ncbi:MAG: tRNA pseudouridine(38-40) synthase TruA [Thermoleophilaceae bacterium]